MKRLSTIAAALLAGVTFAAASGLTINGHGSDPFDDMERIFRLQMQQMRAMQEQMDRLFRNFERNFQSPAIMKMPILVHS